jgi:hypothetical protein
MTESSTSADGLLHRELPPAIFIMNSQADARQPFEVTPRSLIGQKVVPDSNRLSYTVCLINVTMHRVLTHGH